MNNTHLSHISLLRVIAMVTVVLHHTLCFYGAWFPYDDSQTCLNFTLALKDISMPMFIALAGFIYSYLKVNHGKYNNTGTFVLGKAKRLLLPYLLWSAVLLTFSPRFSWQVVFPFQKSKKKLMKDFLITSQNLNL